MVAGARTVHGPFGGDIVDDAFDGYPDRAVGGGAWEGFISGDVRRRRQEQEDVNQRQRNEDKDINKD